MANGGNEPNDFKIKIWANGSNSEADVLYDKQRGVAESSDLATVLADSSIVIHKEKPVGKAATTKEWAADAATLRFAANREQE